MRWCRKGGQEAQDSFVTMFEWVTWPSDRSVHLKGGKSKRGNQLGRCCHKPPRDGLVIEKSGLEK